MKAAKLRELSEIIDRYRDGQATLSDLTHTLDWPLTRGEAILNQLGIIGLDGRIAENLTTSEIIMTLLWYYVNLCLARTSNRPVK